MNGGIVLSRRVQVQEAAENAGRAVLGLVVDGYDREIFPEESSRVEL